MGEIKQPYERIAQSYALQIYAGVKTLGDVPDKPAFLKPRVVEILAEY